MSNNRELGHFFCGCVFSSASWCIDNKTADLSIHILAADYTCNNYINQSISFFSCVASTQDYMEINSKDQRFTKSRKLIIGMGMAM